MFSLLFDRPLTKLLTVVAVAVLAPVICPILGVILKPLVKPATNLYLDLTDEMAEAMEERDRLHASQKGKAEPTGAPAPPKKSAQKLKREEQTVEKGAAAAIIKGVAEIM